MVPEINYIAVVLATLSTMVVGSVWYARPVFGTWWGKAAKVEANDQQYPVAGAIILTVIVSFITSLVLAGSAALAQHFYGGNFLVNTLLTGLILWAGFTAARFITHDAFEGRSKLLTLLNIAHEVVTVLVMALIIGLFGFPG